MFHWVKTWWQGRIIRQSQFTEAQWQNAFQHLSLLDRLTSIEKIKLKRLAILFLHTKSLESVGELEITPLMQLYIALQACLPILNLGLHWYRGWVSVVIYPSTFLHDRNEIDEYGVVHQGTSFLSGEAWQRGPVILSWDGSVHRGGSLGRNVIIHEFAHKLDMLNGKANGFPPLHNGISAQHWTHVFNESYADFNRRLEEGEPVPIDSYAATSPGEFFAVFSEVFFEKPTIMKHHYPDVYQLLVLFYRQDPLVLNF